MSAPSRRPLGCGPELPLQLSHFVVRLWPNGVLRSGLAGQSLALTRYLSMTTAGTLPSSRVMPHGLRRNGSRRPVQYYDPPGLPLRTPRFRLGLIRARLPRLGPRRRVSHVPLHSLHTCCSPYPAAAIGALRFSRRWCCLHRDMSGSACGLQICRGCRLHFMLRPACLLPAVRLAPLHGLLTPRSGTEVSLQYLGPATRRTDAYRNGILTRWSGAASQGHPRPLGLWSFLDVTTHHASIVRVTRGQGKALHRSRTSYGARRAHRGATRSGQPRQVTEAPSACKHCSSLLAPSARGVDYVDLCGEPAWVRRMIDAYDAQPRNSGARIVSSCSIDSIPRDLGVAMLREEIQQKFGMPASRVGGRVRKMKGRLFGGTAASLKAR